MPKRIEPQNGYTLKETLDRIFDFKSTDRLPGDSSAIQDNLIDDPLFPNQNLAAAFVHLKNALLDPESGSLNADTCMSKGQVWHARVLVEKLLTQLKVAEELRLVRRQQLSGEAQNPGLQRANIERHGTVGYLVLPEVVWTFEDKALKVLHSFISTCRLDCVHCLRTSENCSQRASEAPLPAARLAQGPQS